MTNRKYTSRSQQTTLTSAITSGATSMTVASATNLLADISAASIASDTATFTVVVDPDTALEEIVDITAASSNTFTITRSVDATGTAQAHSAGAAVRHMIIGRDLREPNTHTEASSSVHGLAATGGVVVGTAQIQTLTNKTFTTPTINGATLSGTITSTATVSGGTITGAAVTGLSAPSSGSDAATKTYVDAILGSATSAGISAASAAVSATAAATSATSAAASATAAATSATSSAASATASASSAATATTQATAAATSATSAAASATAAATSATSAAASATAAGTSANSASASATTAAASVATIATYASNANAYATTAGTSATSAAASATAAATSASSASASATTASNSATTATTQASNAATSATSAAASATAAATSASSAAASQTAAATSASSAATSASSAATSASDAATTYDNFDDRYLGSKSSAPTLDNDGNSLLTGAMYWNSTSSLMFVWSGSAWVQITTASAYAAPTIGSTTIASGTTYSTITALTLSGGLAAADPSVALGLATKQYVDAVVGNTNYHAPVVAATNTNFAATYNNGTSGVGATLTSSTTGVFTFDGVTVALNDRILVRAQTTGTQNGIYTVTTLGATGVACVLTRAADSDNNPAGEMANGDVVFCLSGTVNSGKTFINSTSGTITIGTTAITYSEYATALPSQTSNSGKYLTTDGTSASWGTVTTYTAPTLGSTSIGSGATVSNVVGLTINSTTIPSSKTLVDTDSSQTLTNKTLTAPVINTATNAQTTSYTLVLADNSKLVEMGASVTANNLTVPLNSSVAFPVGSKIDILQTSSLQCTVVATGGVTINATPGLKLREQWSSATLIKRATDTWVLIGDLSA